MGSVARPYRKDPGFPRSKSGQRGSGGSAFCSLVSSTCSKDQGGSSPRGKGQCVIEEKSAKVNAVVQLTNKRGRGQEGYRPLPPPQTTYGAPPQMCSSTNQPRAVSASWASLTSRQGPWFRFRRQFCVDLQLTQRSTSHGTRFLRYSAEVRSRRPRLTAHPNQPIHTDTLSAATRAPALRSDLTHTHTHTRTHTHTHWVQSKERWHYAANWREISCPAASC